MATWPTSPAWSDINGVNKGNEYAGGDGIYYSDLNIIVNNINYLHNNASGGGGLNQIVELQNVNVKNITENNDGYAVDYTATVKYTDPATHATKSHNFESKILLPLWFSTYLHANIVGKQIQIEVADGVFYTINKDSDKAHVPAYSPTAGVIDVQYAFPDTGSTLVQRGLNGEARFKWILADQWKKWGTSNTVDFEDTVRQLVYGRLIVDKTESDTGTLTTTQLYYLQKLPQYQIQYNGQTYYRMDPLYAPNGTLQYIHIDSVRDGSGGYKATGKCFSVRTLGNQWKVFDLEFGSDGTINVPISKGTGTNSLVGNDTATNTAISENVTSFGTGNIGGLKGYYWSAINLSAKTITLASAHTGGTPVNCEYAVGDVISIVNGAKYNNCSRITAISSNIVTVDSFPFTKIESETPAFDNYCIYCNAKPTIGTADLGKNAVVFGDNNKSGNRSSFVAGRDNAGVGQYAFAAGRGNTVAYASFAAGRNNNISHDYSCGIGWNNTSGGQVSTLIGYGNTGRGSYNFLIGASNDTSNNVTEQISIGFANHSEAKTTFSIGKNNKHYLPNGTTIGTNNIGQGGVCLGDNNIVGGNQYTVGKNNRENFGAANVYRFGESLRPNSNQTIVGRYNKQVSSTASFIVGIGTSDTDRKNGMWITSSGNLLIGGSKLTLNANGTQISLSADQLTELLNSIDTEKEITKTISDTGTLDVSTLAALQSYPQIHIQYDNQTYYRMDPMSAPDGTLNYVHIDSIQDGDGGYKATGKCFSVTVSTRAWQVVDLDFGGGTRTTHNLTIENSATGTTIYFSLTNNRPETYEGAPFGLWSALENSPIACTVDANGSYAAGIITIDGDNFKAIYGNGEELLMTQTQISITDNIV